MSKRLSSAIVFAGSLLAADRAAAQRATVQQPVFERFSVNTVVSVPDRGRAHLGSISRAASGRKSFGPIFGRPGSSVGLSREHSGISSSVYVHDFEEMDRFLLSRRSARQRSLAGPKLNPTAEHAYRSLMGRGSAATVAANSRSGDLGRGTLARYSTGRSLTGRSTTRSADTYAGTASRAENFYLLGLRAERDQRPSVASLHFRTAARYGSAAAARKLSAIDRRVARSRFR